MASIAIAAGAAHLPFLNAPLGSDEGGFLMVAAQWAPGTSLYGNYWVDRPPLLIEFFSIADRLGGAVPLRLMGIATILVAVLASGRIGSLLAANHRMETSRVLTGGVAGALTAAIFLASPLFGTAEVNGELISVAAILSSMALGLYATRSAAHRRYPGLALAGALAASAILVKQNQVDAFIFLTGLVAVIGLHGVSGSRLSGVRRDATAIAMGAGATVVVVLAFAAARGTAPVPLWDALVLFRVDASMIIQSSASAATGERLWGLLGVLALTGAPLLVLQLLTRLRAVPRSGPRPTTGPDLRWVAVAVLAWEVVSVIGGGSYWLHYLISLVPGLVLAAAVTAAARPGAASTAPPLPVRLTRPLASPFVALIYCAAVAGVSLTSSIASPSQGSTEDPTSTWLAAHATAGDSAVVAYGHPNILEGADISSPYPYLWSLIVRVKDPDLTLLTSTLTSEDRPDWLITGSGGLHGWGIDPTTGDEQLAEHYRPVATVDDHVIYLQKSRRLS